MDIDTVLLLSPLALGLTAAFNTQGAEIAARRGRPFKHWTTVVLIWTVLSLVPALFVTGIILTCIEGGYSTFTSYHVLELEDYVRYAFWVTGGLVFMQLPLLTVWVTVRDDRARRAA